MFVSSTQREEAFLRPVVLLRRSLLAAGLTGAGVIGALAYLRPSSAYSEQFRPDGEPWNPVQTMDIPALSPALELDVANATQLASAVNTINTTSSAGHHIVLANGSYSGSYTIYAQGTEANPIVIRPSTFLGATLTGTLTVVGSWVIVYGLHARAIELTRATISSTTYRAANCRVSRCSLTGGGKLEMNNGASYCCFDRNLVSGGSGRLITMGTGSGSDASFKNCMIYNHVKDNTSTSTVPFQINTGSYSTVNVDLQALIAWNRVENNAYDIAMQSKASGVRILQNTFVNNGPSNKSARWAITLRHGRRCYVGGNWIDDKVGIAFRGDDQEVIGNITQRTSSGSGAITANPGNIPDGSEQEPSWNASTQGTGWTFARRAKIIGNQGALWISGGTSTRPYPARDCLIEAHTTPPGSISIESGAIGAIDRRNSPASVEVPPAFELSASEVGPYS